MELVIVLGTRGTEISVAYLVDFNASDLFAISRNKC